ncbi:MAG: hypothetical protein PHT69_06405 [Bacteroidales bacterium]|nr:hypothetical protein [Bacteroidales bacterium]
MKTEKRYSGLYFYLIRLFLLSSFFLFFTCHLLAIKGRIVNNKGEFVPNAEIKFTNSEDPESVITTTSDNQGYYNVSLPIFKGNNSNSIQVFNNYPNPFTNGTVIPFNLNEDGDLKVFVSNYIGQLVVILHDGYMPAGFHQLTWNGLSNDGLILKQGFYFYTFVFNNYMVAGKMLMMGNTPTGIEPVSVPLNNLIEDFDPILYNINVKATGHSVLNLSHFSFAGINEKDFTLTKYSPVPYACVGNYLGKEISDGVYEPFYIMGINLGISIPGTNPGQMAATRQQYRDWLNRIGEIGFNSIRVYTLHYPRFYEELALYNHEHADNPIYLFQGIWLDEDQPAGNLYSFTQEFFNDIEEVTDCIYGNRVIPERQGRAFGTYETDVSPWVMGYIIGREVHPDEVQLTDSQNPSQTSYSGTAVSMQQGSPSAIWFTKSIDHLISYERATYGSERPVSQSSWPTLDPLTHPTEQPSSTEDVAEIDMTGIELINAPAGYFASYHAYPYFPDFISEQPNYKTYSDDVGPNSYLGYLTDLKNHYSDFPLVIAEFGIPNSWGNAHFAHSGMNHGGQDEIQQGLDNVRLMKNIHNTNCGGGFLFAWIDEWFKQCWYTNPIGSYLDRRPLWHNVVSAEENFGLISFDEPAPTFSEWAATQANCFLSSVKADFANDFFYLRLQTLSPFAADDTLWIAYDTYRSDWGESILPNGVSINNRAEFVLRITYDSARLFVTEAYNTFGIYHEESGSEQLYHSIPTDGAPWKPVVWKNNHWPDAIDDIGKLIVKHPGQTFSSKDAVIFNGLSIDIKIPWSLIHFTDPSLREVLHDNRNTSVRETYTSDGIALTVSINNCLIETQRHAWPTWNEAPITTEREKASLNIIKQAIQILDFAPN